MELLTNGIELPRTGARSTTIVRPQTDHQQETENSDVKASQIHWEWKLQPVSPLLVVNVPPRREFETVSVPTPVHAFVRSVAKIPMVKCVVVEDGEGGSVHITTFVDGLTDELRNEIYAVEIETIQENPNQIFDFHVRRAEEVSGSPASISGKHYYAIWGDLDADRR
jgi:hypothetical protein